MYYELSFFLSFSSYFHETYIIIGMSVTSSSYNILRSLFVPFLFEWNFCIFEYERWMEGNMYVIRASLRAQFLAEFNEILGSTRIFVLPPLFGNNFETFDNRAGLERRINK